MKRTEESPASAAPAPADMVHFRFRSSVSQMPEMTRAIATQPAQSRATNYCQLVLNLIPAR